MKADIGPTEKMRQWLERSGIEVSRAEYRRILDLGLRHKKASDPIGNAAYMIVATMIGSASGIDVDEISKDVASLYGEEMLKPDVAITEFVEHFAMTEPPQTDVPGLDSLVRTIRAALIKISDYVKTTTSHYEEYLSAMEEVEKTAVKFDAVERYNDIVGMICERMEWALEGCSAWQEIVRTTGGARLRIDVKIRFVTTFISFALGCAIGEVPIERMESVMSAMSGESEFFKGEDMRYASDLLSGLMTKHAAAFNDESVKFGHSVKSTAKKARWDFGGNV